MILTTNQVHVIDPAFKSRIHLSIAYPDLANASRRQLWETFLARTSTLGRPGWLNDEFLNRVAETIMNGREIKNAVRVAHALATQAHREMVGDDIESVLRLLKSFDQDIRRFSAKRPLAYNDLNETSKRQRIMMRLASPHEAEDIAHA